MHTRRRRTRAALALAALCGALVALPSAGVGAVPVSSGEPDLQIIGAPYWPGWDIARDVATCIPDDGAFTFGWVLDGFGGLHGFSVAAVDDLEPLQPPDPSLLQFEEGYAYTPGVDQYRAAVTVACGNDPTDEMWAQGYVINGAGKMWGFSYNRELPGPAGVGHYGIVGDWVEGATPLFEVADVFGLGYVVDGHGDLGVWGFVDLAETQAQNIVIPSGPHWSWDIARGMAQSIECAADPLADAQVLDGWGALHYVTLSTLDDRAPLGGGPYWPGWDIARGAGLLSYGYGTGADQVFANGLIVDGWGGLHPYWGSQPSNCLS